MTTLDRMQPHPPPNYPPPPPPIPSIEASSSPRPTTPRSAKSPAPDARSPDVALARSQNASPNPNSPSPSSKKDLSVHPTRRASLSNLLRRSKSSERGPPKKLSKKGHPAMPPLPKAAPRLPEIPIGLGVASGSKTLGEAASAYENASRSLESSASHTGVTRPSVDIPSIKRGFNINEDPYGGVGSITNRGRYSYASSAVSTINSPRRLRKRKDPVPFNILVIGAANSGKSEFVRFLKQSLAPKPKKGAPKEQVIEVDDSINGMGHDFDENENSSFTKTYIENDIDGERVGITIWDSAGFEKGVVDLQLRETSAFIESKFEETFTEETRISRLPGVQDTHIHCTFFLLDASNVGSGFILKASSRKGGSKETVLDEELCVQVFRALKGKTTVIPVIAKADTCTSAHMAHLKRLVVKALQGADINPLEELDLEIDFTEKPRRRKTAATAAKGLTVPEEDENPEPPKSASESFYEESSSEDEEDEDSNPVPIGDIIPFSIISPDTYTSEFVGRKFPWGFADPMEITHCDFVKLKVAVFNEWRNDLREASREIWYENWRTSRLQTTGSRGASRGRRLHAS